MCDERERLIGYLYDECDAHDRQLVDTHLETCQTCRDEIGGLRRVREDLLAWDVPSRESVWQPFAPPRQPVWWREVPGWALAAAASITFLAGAAGGVVTYALMPQAFTTATIADRMEPREPMVPVVYDNVTRRELTTAEQRIVDMLRAEMADRLSRVSAQANSPATLRVSNTSAAALQPLGDSDHEELLKIVTAITEDMIEHRRVTQGEVQNLRSQLDSVRAAMVSSPPGK